MPLTDFQASLARLLSLNRTFDSFTSLPLPDEISLVVEVSDTTLRFDLRDKASLYARAGIIECWVVDLNGRKLIVHREPKEGHYTSVVSYDENDSVAPLAAPERTLAVRSLFS